MTPLEGAPYVLLRQLGTGAAGDVFEAQHTSLGTRRALKVLREHNIGKTEIVERMKVEARTLATLKHKNLVEVVDLGMTTNGRIWFAMELLEGTNLRQTITSNKSLRADVAIDLALELLEGLGAAHAAGIVHRDVKPENVFVCSSGAVKVLDFGTAKVNATSALTQSGFAVGTLQYMAPEQIEGNPIDARTDLYAVGLVLYEMLTGKPPFEDRDNVSLAFAHATRPPPTIAEKLGEPVPAALEHVVARALAKKKEDRFASADEMARALAACAPQLRASAPPSSVGKGFTFRMSTIPTSAPPPSDPIALVRRRERSLVPALIVVAGVALFGVAGALALAHATRSTTASQSATATGAASASAPATATGSATGAASGAATGAASASVTGSATVTVSASVTATVAPPSVARPRTAPSTKPSANPLKVGAGL